MTNKISCVITDDEPLARKGLRGYVDKTDFLELRGVFEDAFQLSEFMRANPVDLLFLDIEMPDFTGIEFLKTLKNPPKVIFTTAFEQYAIEGFELEIMDYLLKPISYERFLKATLKAKAYFTSKSQGDPDYLFVKANGKLEKIILSDVLFIEAMENYVAIHLIENKIITHTTIKSLLEKLPAQKFVQTHRSYIVAIDKVQTIDNNILYMNKHQIPLSKQSREKVIGVCKKNRGL
ncbi:MAG: LytTR family DNA-binding domain-containing protein [Mucilaginibacter sp.]|jgi:DNA-binding LytR/AlgR family response regulator|uniref:LytR/AlgR family response regulator transcription factor n=1 Tax=Mucilaginibacter sp. TaxID=1882438 RepID=UPI00356A7883